MDEDAEYWLKVIFDYIAEDNKDTAIRLVTAPALTRYTK